MAEALKIEQIRVLFPDGVLAGQERFDFIVDLVALAGENPEVDPEAMTEALHRAARVIMADGLLLKDWEEVKQHDTARDEVDDDLPRRSRRAGREHGREDRVE